MLSRVETELLCSRCDQTTSHTVTVEDGFTTDIRCQSCGTVTVIRPRGGAAARSERAGGPAFLLGGLAVGGGHLLVEGTLDLDGEAPGVYPLPSLLSLARRLKEAGSHYLRLPAASAGQLPALAAIREATGLPVVADVGPRVELVPAAAGAGAAAVILTLATPAGAEAAAPTLLACQGLPIIARIAPGPAVPGGQPVPLAPEQMVQHALLVLQPLDMAGVAPLAVSVPTGDLQACVTVHRLLRARCRHPMRLEYVPESKELFSGLIRAGVALGSLLVEGIGDIISVHLPGHAVGSVEAAAEVLWAIGVSPAGVHLLHQGRTNVLFYYTRKAIQRVLTKPARIAQELNANPRGTAASLPLRILTKPYRLLREIGSMARKIG